MRRLARLVCWVLLCFVLADGGAAAGTAVGVGARVALFAVPSVNVCDRTPAVRDTIVAAVAGIDDCQDVTEAHLSGIGRSLILRRMGITALRVGDFDGLTSLRRLTLRDNSLTVLPAGIFDGLAALDTLSLLNNQLTHLPDGVFADLVALTTLDLEYNDLVSLPPGLFTGLDLEFLGLEGNQLTSLGPEGQGVFSGLRVETLDLSGNRFETVPAGAFEGTDLHLLDLSENQLCELPAGIFEGHTRLAYLWLDQNPGAAFTLTVVLEQIPDTNNVVVRVAEGAPFAMTTAIGVTGGTLPPPSELGHDPARAHNKQRNHYYSH